MALGVMPDWNPAEMIGLKPTPLAYDLYAHLITNRIWSEARRDQGYVESAGPLMVRVLGTPFINVGASLTSFVPADVPSDVRRRVVSACIEQLKRCPHWHDKIEFELKILREALNANGNAVDQPTFVLTDLTFHYTLAMISHNPIFTSIHRTLMDWLSDQRSMSARAGATRAEIFAQHQAIYDAIHARDTAAAQDAMETHLATVARYYWQAMSSADEGAGRETATT
jgi:hypothetical protein